MKVYTKTGDSGSTGLIGGTRVEKKDIRLEAYGTIDELGAFIGLLTAKLQENDENLIFLRHIQRLLFALGGYLATDSAKYDNTKFLQNFEKQIVTDIENEIDRLTKVIPPLTSFILAGTCEEEALCQVCRTIARRAERKMCAMNTLFPIDKRLFVFINRLSDYLFVLSRFLTEKRNKKDLLL